MEQSAHPEHGLDDLATVGAVRRLLDLIEVVVPHEALHGKRPYSQSATRRGRKTDGTLSLSTIQRTVQPPTRMCSSQARARDRLTATASSSTNFASMRQAGGSSALSRDGQP